MNPYAKAKGGTPAETVALDFDAGGVAGDLPYKQGYVVTLGYDGPALDPANAWNYLFKRTSDPANGASGVSGRPGLGGGSWIDPLTNEIYHFSISVKIDSPGPAPAAKTSGGGGTEPGAGGGVPLKKASLDEQFVNATTKSRDEKNHPGSAVVPAPAPWTLPLTPAIRAALGSILKASPGGGDEINSNFLVP